MRLYSMTVGCWNWEKGERDLSSFRTVKIVAPAAYEAEQEASALLGLTENMDVLTVLEAVELDPEECGRWAQWHAAEPSAVELRDAVEVGEAVAKAVESPAPGKVIKGA